MDGCPYTHHGTHIVHIHTHVHTHIHTHIYEILDTRIHTHIHTYGKGVPRAPSVSPPGFFSPDVSV